IITPLTSHRLDLAFPDRLDGWRKQPNLGQSLLDKLCATVDQHFVGWILFADRDNMRTKIIHLAPVLALNFRVNSHLPVVTVMLDEVLPLPSCLVEIPPVYLTASFEVSKSSKCRVVNIDHALPMHPEQLAG